MRRWLLAVGGLAAVAAAAAIAACSSHQRGYLSPQFSTDGASVVVIARDTRAFTIGFGYETFTPPARTFVLRDRFALLRIHLDDGRVETLQAFPPSPIEGGWVRSYRPSLTGSVSAHLRWADRDALEYAIAVSRPREPTSETWVTRRRWNAGTRTFEETTWTPGSGGMGGTEPTQLHGAREVIAVRAGGALPCAVVVVTEGQPRAKAVIEEPECRKAHPDGYAVAQLTDEIQRPSIERVEQLRTTHERLVAEARSRGLSEGDAALDAIRGMQQLGFYPKPSTLVATPASATEAGIPVFEISDMEFAVGLFTDIREAIDKPGVEVEKSSSTYIIHRDYDTSRQLNAWLDDPAHTSFYVRSRGELWRLELTRR